MVNTRNPTPAAWEKGAGLRVLGNAICALLTRALLKGPGGGKAQLSSLSSMPKSGGYVCPDKGVFFSLYTGNIDSPTPACKGSDFSQLN